MAAEKETYAEFYDCTTKVFRGKNSIIKLVQFTSQRWQRWITVILKLVFVFRMAIITLVKVKHVDKTPVSDREVLI